MTLQEAIEQLVNIGETDPLEIAKKIEKQHDKHWLSSELLALSEDIIPEMARRVIGAQRRSAELALRPGDVITSSEMKIRTRWIPGGIGWKKVADLTADDLGKLARWYEKLADASLRRTQWCQEVIALMKDEGVDTLGRLKAALPPLPPAELEEVAA